MLCDKCKNAVFSVLFFVSFCLGTIFGVFLLRVISKNGSEWLTSYCTVLEQAEALSPGSALFALLRPVMLVFVAGMIPKGYRLLPVLIFFRGCLTAYTASACYITGMTLSLVILRGLVLLPLFYFFCRWVYLMQTRNLTAGQVETS